MPTQSASRPARERLLTAATQLFYEQGIAATGVDAVLARAGVSPSTLYAHFAGKDALVAAYLEQRHHEWRAAWDGVLTELTDPRDRLLSVFDAVARFRDRSGNRRGCAFLAAATELPAGHPGQHWLTADTALLVERLRDLAEVAGAGRSAELALELLLLYDGALAGFARNATTPRTASDDPIGRARAAAVSLLATRLVDPRSSDR